LEQTVVGSARAVVTMGMPAFAYRWYFGAHGLKSLTQNLALVGITPLHPRGHDRGNERPEAAGLAASAQCARARGGMPH
jgi:putative NADPH-quinone reductase